MTFVNGLAPRGESRGKTACVIIGNAVCDGRCWTDGVAGMRRDFVAGFLDAGVWRGVLIIGVAIFEINVPKLVTGRSDARDDGFAAEGDVHSV